MEAYGGIAFLRFNSYDLIGPDGWDVQLYYQPIRPSWSAVVAERSAAIPLYLLAAPFVVASTVMFIRARRALPGCCRKCGYDLSGITAEACPECGHTA